MDKELIAKLQAPFPPEDIEWRIGSTNQDKTRGLAVPYITNRAIQNRLDEVFGPLGWQNKFEPWKDGQLCGIGVYDAKKGQWIWKYDGAPNTNFAEVKGGLSDAMKRAAYQWGIGRYLYKLPSVWVRIKKVGKSYVPDEEPQLPEWALPEGYKGKGRKSKPKQTNNRRSAPEKAPEKKNGNSERGTNGVNRITDSQMRYLHRIVHNIGMSDDVLKALIQDKYGVASRKELTIEQATEVINHLLAVQKGTAEL